MTGVTGTQTVDAVAIAANVARVRQHSPVPVAVGFGVNTPDDARAVAAFADAVVVGSALVQVIATYGRAPELLEEVQRFARALKSGVHAAAVST
jgi:tryptophan synthase alpha chain